MIVRGNGAGTRQRVKTKLQVAATLYTGATRPQLAPPRFTPGSRRDPTGAIFPFKPNKKQAAVDFNNWIRRQSPEHITVYTDGSKFEYNLGYGYLVHRHNDDTTLARGCASLDPQGVVFDAEGVGAWRGLERALQVAPPTAPITVCLDNTSAIWCLRGKASESSQWAFLAFHNAVDRELAMGRRVSVKWSPGHTSLWGNEEADALAKEGTKSQPDPDTGPTVSTLRRAKRRNLDAIRARLWRTRSATASTRYRSWELQYKKKCPEELKLPRPTLQRYLAVRSGHGDFAWYHKRFHHEDAELECQCGADKAPDHLVFCRIARRSFGSWPWPADRPREPLPWTRDEAKRYLGDLMDSPQAFKDFLDVTKFYTEICK